MSSDRTARAGGIALALLALLLLGPAAGRGESLSGLSRIRPDVLDASTLAAGDLQLEPWMDAFWYTRAFDENGDSRPLCHKILESRTGCRVTWGLGPHTEFGLALVLIQASDTTASGGVGVSTAPGDFGAAIKWRLSEGRWKSAVAGGVTAPTSDASANWRFDGGVILSREGALVNVDINALGGVMPAAEHGEAEAAWRIRLAGGVSLFEDLQPLLELGVRETAFKGQDASRVWSMTPGIRWDPAGRVAFTVGVPVTLAGVEAGDGAGLAVRITLDL